MGSYSGARQDSNAGFQSAILTCQVSLLNEGESTSAAHSVAWIGVNNADQDDPKWAQMGYVRHREKVRGCLLSSLC